ncbi:hypothetical protein B0O99DRAFT_156810 [Bisporella sp. PMI_857]|nr:hypothetical protein B0O99DRAFT_156810 [Bisporella sp. PMI_857]
MIYQCPRCKTLFESQQALDIHIVKPKGCPVNISGRAEGITSQTRQQLQCRKKAYCGQSDPELWQNIYRILFPTEEPPSPWFEPIQEDTADGPDSREIGRIEDYLRLQVPQYVRSALESAVDSEMQPIDERLRAQLMDMVEEAQNRAFSDYHAVLNSRERISSMSGSRHSSAPGLATMNQSSNILDDFYVPPQPRSHLDPGVDCPFGTVAGSSTLNEWSDTGYSSSLPEQPTEQPVATRGGDCLLPTRATQILNDPIHEYIGHTSETQFNHPPSATSQEAVGRVAIGTLSLHNDNSKLGAHDLFAFDFDKYESLYDLSSHAQ